MKKRILCIVLNLALLLSVFGGLGLLSMAAADEPLVSTVLLGEGDDDKLIDPADNLLKGAAYERTDKTGNGSCWVSNATWAAMFDGQAQGVNSATGTVAALGGLKAPDDGVSDYTSIYVAFDLQEPYRFDSFLLAGNGDGSYGVESIALFVGNENLQTVINENRQPQWEYNQRVSKGLLVDLKNAGFAGRYLILRLGTKSNSQYWQAWLSELAATGKPVKVPSTESWLGEGDGDKLIDPADNVLKDVSCLRTDATGSVKDNSVILKVSDANWEQLFDGQALGVNSTSAGVVALGGSTLANQKDNAVDKGVDYSALYLAFDMKESYRFSRFFVAGNGDGIYGPQSVALYVGDEDVFSLIQSGAAMPQYQCSSRVVKEGLLVEFGEVLTGRYFIVKLAGRLSGGVNYLTHLSELAAVGEPVNVPASPVETLGAQVRDVDEAGRTALRFGFTLSCAGVGYEDETHAGNNYRRALDNATVTVGRKEYTLVDFGAIVTLKEDVELTKEAVDGSTVKEVPAVNLFEAADGQVTYTAVLVNIPATAASRQIYARSYVTYQDGETTHTIYGDVISRCVDDCGAEIAIG